MFNFRLIPLDRITYSDDSNAIFSRYTSDKFNSKLLFNGCHYTPLKSLSIIIPLIKIIKDYFLLRMSSPFNPIIAVQYNPRWCDMSAGFYEPRSTVRKASLPRKVKTLYVQI